jgi:hypothetical protein
MVLRKPRAGGYAERRYRRGLRSWQLKNRRRFGALFGPFVAAGIVVVILNGNIIAWSAGLLVGAFLTMWIAFRETPPFYVERWRLGFEGERKTEKELRRLERAGWHVAHDVQNGRGNYDHIAVGAAGVYLLDSKNLQGVVDIRGGVPHLARRHDPERTDVFDRVPRRALAGAARLNEEIQARTAHSPWVQAVVVFWSDFPAGVVEDDRCVFIHGPRLRAWLQDRPARLSQVEAEEIVAGIAGIAADAAAEDLAALPSRLRPA